MKQKKDFAAQVAADQKAREHAQEIKRTRVGGLGGSDAALVYKIGLKGLSALTATNHQRLAVMLGLSDQKDWSGNAYTNAGHEFEDYVEENLPFGELKYEREAIMSVKLARHFRTFAHADFRTEDNTVAECKFVQDNTASVVNRYGAQLQWYYLLGARNVMLVHGTGTADPFEVKEVTLSHVEKNAKAIDILIAGIRILDEALESGWQPDIADKMCVADTPVVIQRAFDAMTEIKEREKAIEAEKKEAQKLLKEYIESLGLNGITASDGSKRQVVYVKASVIKTFDVSKFIGEHPEFDLPEYWKITERKSSVTFK